MYYHFLRSLSVTSQVDNIYVEESYDEEMCVILSEK